MTNPLQLARLMIDCHPGIAQASNGLPCAILPVIEEIMAAGAVIIRDRRNNATPKKTYLTSNGTEKAIPRP